VTYLKNKSCYITFWLYLSEFNGFCLLETHSETSFFTMNKGTERTDGILEEASDLKNIPHLT